MLLHILDLVGVVVFAVSGALAAADAFGLGFFVVSGAGIAREFGLPAIGVGVMGVLTGVAGGGSGMSRRRKHP